MQALGIAGVALSFFGPQACDGNPLMMVIIQQVEG
jgi:hypothetical protein